ncbi:MAG: GPI mannosyltransferase 1 [Heterodermia speciosa]|uniref:GPI mannosyltransferase 1 n=1 Tax=Heterodermia speciosa TaxID=116794 RepID=A0A8H3I771_9LECA|nr:MAG: GPI mannosyltransferase 1 [Heterodermia speciosa]
MPFFTPSLVFSSAILLRAILLLYGLFQDAHSSLPYTDIDYFVFTDAARYVSRGHSPYRRETYRYTPLLAWLLLPTTWPGAAWFSFGKVMFAVADIVAGWLMVLVLQSRPGGGTESKRALKFASIWLLNPMVATISTRGSSEGLLGVMVVALVWAVMKRRLVLAGVLLGLAVHFKIYPFIYGVSMLWYLETPPPQTPKQGMRLTEQLVAFVNRSRVVLALSALSTFMVLNIIMYAMYSTPFLTHTYLHHLTRIDHRHNFSPYNTLLHLSSASSSTTSGWHFESLAFIPQLAISAFLIPIALAKKDLPSTMMAQTFAFVAFNKVVTSQYFLWYIVLLPFYLPNSSLLSRPRLGTTAAVLWVAAQAIYLHRAYALEFLGQSTFVPDLWLSSLLFFGVNVWILGIVIDDIGRMESRNQSQGSSQSGEGEKISS